jgi:hypothetical protein
MYVLFAVQIKFKYQNTASGQPERPGPLSHIYAIMIDDARPTPAASTQGPSHIDDLVDDAPSPAISAHSTLTRHSV